MSPRVPRNPSNPIVSKDARGGSMNLSPCCLPKHMIVSSIRSETLTRAIRFWNVVLASIMCWIMSCGVNLDHSV